MPLQHNATVTRLDRSGGGQAVPAGDWDRDTGDEPGATDAKWSGAVRALYRETTDRVDDGQGGVNVLTRRELVIDTADVDALELDTNDVLTFTVDGEEDERIGQAKSIPRPRLAGVRRALQTARVVLEAD